MIKLEQFKKEATEKHGEYYSYELVTSIDRFTDKVIVICPVHGEFTQVAKSHKRGSGCPSCARIAAGKKCSVTKTESFSVFQEKAIAKHGTLYKYHKKYYTNTSEKTLITCPIHGEFWQIPSNHLTATVPCKQCSDGMRIANSKKSQEDFIKDCINQHGDTYDYTDTVYEHSLKPITVICKTHGKFSQCASDHIRGRGCPKCMRNGFNTGKPAILYYLSINNGDVYKIGITNKTVEERFLVSELSSIVVLKTWEYESGEECAVAERRLLKEHKDSRYNGPALLSTGNTELFSTDVLNLDRESH